MPSRDEIDFAPYFYSRHCLIGRDDAALTTAQELRFQVYCEECKFLPIALYPARREWDDADSTAAHFCAFNLEHELVGYARLVEADSARRFPFQNHCTVYPTASGLPAPSAAVEISRMIVRADYRRRRGDTINGVTVDDGEAVERVERRSNSPQILLSLYRQMFQYSRAQGLTHWYAAMERPVARALARIGGFAFHDIGPEEDYFGPVVPYLADLDDIADSVRRRSPAMLDWMTRP